MSPVSKLNNGHSHKRKSKARPVATTKLYQKLLRAWKSIYQVVELDQDSPRTIVFIVGCQRSGTTLLTRLFERDLRSKVYPEISELSSLDSPKHLRLNPLDTVEEKLSRVHAPLIVLKPLVESQNTPELLDYFEGSKAIWLYRNYKAVARSHVNKWGAENSISDLQAIVQRLSGNWRYEKVSDDLRDIVLEYFSENMSEYDAPALYWYVRNRLFFDLKLNCHPGVMVCRYEELVVDPRGQMERVYAFLGKEFPGKGIVSEVDDYSIDKGTEIRLSPGMDSLCSDLLERLDSVLNLSYKINSSQERGR